MFQKNSPVTTAYRRQQIHVIDVNFGPNCVYTVVGLAQTFIDMDTYLIYMANDYLHGN
jgi:23S rRNA A1618 N6-methylase RlmF